MKYNKNEESNRKVFKKDILAVDIETTGLNFLENRIRLISLYSDTQELVTEDIYELQKTLEDERILKIFHNAPFDVSFLKHNGIDVVNYTDTLIIAQVIDGRTQNMSLGILAEEYLGEYLDKGMQHSSNWNGEISEEHKAYALKDSETTHRLYKVLDKKIQELGLEEVLDREIRALPIITELKMKGIKLDWDKWQVELYQLQKDEEVEKEKIYKVLGNINLNSPQQLKQALEEKGIEVEDTTKDELKKHEEEHDVIKDILSYKKIGKYLSSYGEKLKKQIDADNRLRGNWRLIGAATGRMSCSSPAIQAMPGKIRECLIAEEGNTFVLVDYSSIEMRVLALMSKEQSLIDAIARKEDLHKRTISGILGKDIDEITDEERKIGKVLNFMISYGATSYGLKNQLTKALDKDVSLAKAEEYRQLYFKTYPQILRYQEVMLRAPWIKSLGGRSWGLKGNDKPDNAAKIINYPIQSSMTEGMKEAMALLHQKLQEHKSWSVVAIIHDEVIMEVPVEESELAAKVLEEIMIEGMQKITGKEVLIEVDVDIRDSWQ